MRRLHASGVLFVVLAVVYPAAFLLEQNSHLYRREQVVATLAVAILAGVLAAILAGVMGHGLARALRVIRARSAGHADAKASRVTRGWLAGVGTAILMLLLYLPLEELIRNRAVLATLIVLPAVASAILGYYFGVRGANMVLSILIVFTGSQGLWGALQGQTPSATEPRDQGQTPVFRQRPNIYLVILESYNGLSVRSATYGIDNTMLVRSLERMGFVIDEPAYSNYWSTVFSLSSIFLMDHHHYRGSRNLLDGGIHRKVIGGVTDNRALDILQRNGYSIDYSRFAEGLYHPSERLSLYEMQPALQPVELFGGIFRGTVRLLGLDLWHSPAFQRGLRIPDRWLTPTGPTTSPATTAGGPVFSLMYTGARHTPGDGVVSRSQWIAEYRALVAKSDETVVALAQDIVEKDPGALIVLVGDHGAWLHRNAWMGTSSDPNLNMREHGTTPADVTRDLFEVFMAVRWPHARPRSLSHVNLFRAVFGALTGEDSERADLAADDSFAYILLKKSLVGTPRLYRTVRSGQVLENWEPVDDPQRQP